MLVEYKVKNFKSFKDEIVLSMVASSSNEHEETHVVEKGGFRLLKSAAVFGANASGKSNLIESFAMLYRVLSNRDIPYNDFPINKLSKENFEKPIQYEITFVIDDIRYRYELDIMEDFIEHETLYYSPKGIESIYYRREKDKIVKKGKYFEDFKLLNYIKPSINIPFLYTLAQESVKTNMVVAKKAYKSLISITMPMLSDLLSRKLTEMSLDNESSKSKILDILNKFDRTISDISVDEDEEDKGTITSNDDNVEEFFKCNTFLHHSVYNKGLLTDDKEKFDLNEESSGTSKLFCLISPILLTLATGGVLIIDEIESSLHTLICEYIIKWFNNKEHNTNNTQLIFTSHNLLLMNPNLLRRDQIYFMEKDKYGSSSIYSLYDFSIPKDYNYVNNYLAGRFGAIPYLKDFYPNIETK